MASVKKKVLVFIDWYLPGYKAGGPIQSVANIVAHLKDDFEFNIVTGDRDLHSDVIYDNIKLNQWNLREDGSSVYYISSDQQNIATIKKLILASQADVIYLNSLFSKTFTIFPLIVRNRLIPTRRVVLAPRGMLGEGALNIKPGKKKLFLTYAKLTGLYKKVRWHASSENESEEIYKQFGKHSSVSVALNLTAANSLTFQPRVKEVGKLKMVFISRISYKKNLEGALSILKKISSALDINFDIYGPIEDENYWNQCQEIIQSLPVNISVNYRGVLKNEEVINTLQNYHLSILLTFNENFGHSIVESLAAGCPVLISDQTPWKHLQENKAGWDLPLSDEKAILAAIEKCANMNQLEFNAYSEGALKFADGIINNKEAIVQNKKLFS
jgi:glycosyltransferase involved in cell wall biosynthesis